MTSAPSVSLHVLPPAPADIKAALDNPPTPLTPRTLNSAMSSRAHLPDDGTNPATVQSTSSLDPTPSETGPAMLVPSEVQLTSSDGSEPVIDVSAAKKAAEEPLVQNPLLGLKCTPPDMLPPSPPLTVAEPREGSELEEVPARAGSVQSQRRGDTSVPSGMREEDITEWRISVHKEEDEDEHSAVGDGEYDPYDLGYSPDPTPITPVGRSGHAGNPTANALQTTPDHPLRLDSHAPSPPPWELIDPPEPPVGLRSMPSGSLQMSNHPPKPRPSRPLIPRSAYYVGPPPIDSAYGTDPIGQIGLHHPREIIRVERDYSGGELVQFASSYPLELEGRITPTQFLETINTINERLIDAHSLRHSFIDNALSFLTLQLSKLVMTSHYEKEMRRLHETIDELNSTLYNPAGLNILWPRNVAFMFLEIEYY